MDMAGPAACTATPADHDRIRTALTACVAADDCERRDAALHRAIVQATHNSLLIEMFDVIDWARALPVWGGLKRRTSTLVLCSRYGQEHAEIVIALVDRDPRAASEHMHRHLEHVTGRPPGRHVTPPSQRPSPRKARPARHRSGRDIRKRQMLSACRTPRQ